MNPTLGFRDDDQSKTPDLKLCLIGRQTDGQTEQTKTINRIYSNKGSVGVAILVRKCYSYDKKFWQAIRYFDILKPTLVVFGHLFSIKCEWGIY